MPTVTTADTKRRLMEAATKIINEVPIVTEEDLAEVKMRINNEAVEILASDNHIYKTVEVKVTILNREIVEGPIEICVSTKLSQRLVTNKKIMMEKSSKGSVTFSSSMAHTACRCHKFYIRQVPSLLTLSARTVNKALAKSTAKFCKTKTGKYPSADESRISTPNAPTKIKAGVNLLFDNQQFLSETLEIPLDCVQSLKKDFDALTQKYSKNRQNSV